MPRSRSSAPRSAAKGAKGTRNPVDTAASFGYALQLHQHGRLQQAAAAYREILAADPKHFDAWHLLGVIAAQSRQFEEALRLFDKAIDLCPGNAAFLCNRGLALHDLGRLDEAIASFSRAIALQGNHAEAYYSRGAALQQLGRLHDAIVDYGRAIALRPDYAEAYYNRGSAYRVLDRWSDSVCDFERAIGLNPADTDAGLGMGLSLQKMGRLDDAVRAYDHVLSLRSDCAEAYRNRGAALRDLRRLDEALASCRRAVELAPADAQSHNNLGAVLKALGNFDQALTSFDRAIALSPGDPEAFNNRGNVLQDLGRPADAMACFDTAIALRPAYAEAHNNRGLLLRALQRLDESLASFDAAVSLRPDYAEAHSNRGLVLDQLGRLDESLASFDRAIALKPDLPDVSANKGFALLRAEQFEAGWPLFEQRKVLRRGGVEDVAPMWDGKSRVEALQVLAEQGVGDEIFFSSMLPELAPYASRVCACVDRRLVPLFRRSFGEYGIDFEPRETPLSPQAHKIFLASLGAHFRRDRASLRNVRSPFLRACPERAAKLREQLVARDRALVCGLSWSSKNAQFGVPKSVTLEALRPLMSVPGVSWVNLQYGDTADEQERLRRSSGHALINVDSVDNFEDLEGLAALISACDLVVTVSNTTAHLAAALGKPVLIMLPLASGSFWFWHRTRTDSPWYPSAKLFRQPVDGDWDSVIESIKQELLHRVASRAADESARW